MNLYSAYTDKDLLRLLLQDDMPAFTELYNRHWKKLYSSVYNVLRNAEVARDIVQDIFTSLWERRAELDIQFVCAYLKQAARFQVFNAIRNNKADAGFYQRMAGVSSTIIQENPLLFKELQQVLGQVLTSLPEDQRKAFLLSREAGLSYKEIANNMHISPKTVEKKMSLTLKRLRLSLDKTFLFLGTLLMLHF